MPFWTRMLPAVVLAAAWAAPALAQPAHTAADVRFMQGMIPHHAQALEMAALVPARTERREIRLIAERIAVSQGDEIAWMRRWLLDRGAEAPDPTTGHGAHAGHDHAVHDGHAQDPAHAHDAGHDDAHDADHGDGHGPGGDHARMPGMASPEEMAALAEARGAAFDRLFLQLMIRHHEGALVMVAELLATPGAAQTTEVYRFSSDVEADQQAEIARMRALLDRLPPAAAAPPAPHAH